MNWNRTPEPGADLLDRLRREPRYTIAEAARLAGTSPQLVRAWLRGQMTTSGGRSVRPVIPHEGPLLSFLDLAEVVVVRGFREGRDGVARISLRRLRVAHEFARQALGIEHPFASRRLFYEGGHIMHEFEGANPGPGRLSVDLGGQFALPFSVQELGQQFDFDTTLDQLALRWFPAGRAVRVVVDPAVAAGRPAIAGRNLRVDFIAGRFKRAGESIDWIAEDLELDREVVEAALRIPA